MLLLTTVIGSGIMAERLSGKRRHRFACKHRGDGRWALRPDRDLRPVSGAHFNPAVSAVLLARGALTAVDTGVYIVAQLCGAALGAWLAHAMFDMSILQFSTKFAAARANGSPSGGHGRTDPRRASLTAGRAAGLVAAYTGPPTGSPLRRRLPTPLPRSAECSATASGIASLDSGFMLAELAGALLGWGAHAWLYRSAMPLRQSSPSD